MAVERSRAHPLSRTWAHWICAIVVATVMVGCSDYWGERTLKLDDIQFLNIQQTQPEQLRIAGLAMHSSLSVARIESVPGNRTLQVRVMLVPARKGQSGRFAYDVVLDDTVDKVTFGDEQALIWTREGGVVRHH